MITRISAGRGVLLACILGLLSACGSDRSQTEGGRTALGAVAGLAAKLRPAQDTRAAPDPEQMAVAAKASFDGPIILAQIENAGLLTVLGEYGRNGVVRTYSTPDERTLVLRHGLIVATRGFGHDLMSSETGSAAAHVTRRQAGTSERSYRYLDGENRERPLPMQCTYRPGASKALSFAGAHHATVQVDEICQVKGQSLTITNNYWVAGDGTIALSRQWIGPALGYVTIQLVRP